MLRFAAVPMLGELQTKPRIESSSTRNVGQSEDNEIERDVAHRAKRPRLKLSDPGSEGRSLATWTQSPGSLQRMISHHRLRECFGRQSQNVVRKSRKSSVSGQSITSHMYI